MNRLVIVGASGHGRVVADCAEKNGYTDIVFLDDASLTSCGPYPVVGRSGDVAGMDGDVIVAIGDAAARRRVQERIDPARLATLVHPSAVLGGGVRLGAGTVVLAGAVINPEAIIGRGCIVNTAATVDHDCRVGDFAHIAVGAHLCGTVSVGADTWVGAGAVVSNNVTICGGCTIGAGAAVVKDITERGTYVGVPARKR